MLAIKASLNYKSHISQSFFFLHIDGHAWTFIVSTHHMCTMSTSFLLLHQCVSSQIKGPVCVLMLGGPRTIWRVLNNVNMRHALFCGSTVVDPADQNVPLIEGLMSHLVLRLFHFFSRRSPAEGRGTLKQRWTKSCMKKL